MASGQIVTKHYADGDAGIDIYIGPNQSTSLLPPLRILSNTGALLALIDTVGGSFFTGSLTGQRQITNGNFTVASNDFNIFCDASAGAINITLLSAGDATIPGGVSRVIRFYRMDSSGNAITINRVNADTINGGTSYIMIGRGQCVELTARPTSATTGEWLVTGGTQLISQVQRISTSPQTITQSSGYLRCDATSGNITVNLPAANSQQAAGKTYHIIKNDASANTVTVSRAGADTIEGAATVVLAAQWDKVIVTSDQVSTWWKF